MFYTFEEFNKFISAEHDIKYKCGLTEALWDFFKHEKKTTN